MARKIDLAELTSVLLDHPLGSRLIVGIAGAPGSGKSTMADALAERVNAVQPDRAALLPMDGYHYDDGVLDDLGRLSRKGAVDTFDIDGLAHMLTRLRENKTDTIAVPVFDRSIEIARAGARLIYATSDIIIVEGNYLLLNKAPWDGLAGFFDISVMIQTDRKVLRNRLIKRWLGLGFEKEDAMRKVEGNDLPNGRMVIASSKQADFALMND